MNTLIDSLRKKISDTLTPLITHDYVYLDLPYHPNIGDTLIWEGTREFLNTLPYKCLYYASKDSFRYRQLPKNVVILFISKNRSLQLQNYSKNLIFAPSKRRCRDDVQDV